MKKHNSIFAIALFAFVASIAFMVATPSNSNIALFWVVKNTVEKKDSTDQWVQAKKGDFIYPGNFVRTEKESFTLVKFNDASTLRLGSNAEVQIYGDKNPQSANVSSGDVGFTMTKRTNGQFEFTTPTSVASIRGTEGVVTVQMDGTDFLTIVEGLVQFTNKFSNKTIDVSAGQTGESSKDGGIDVHQSTQEDLNRLSQLDNQFNQQQHKLEVWFLGSDGKLHEVIIETQQ
ncbi:MAG TPA: FecR family protein [Candidatus Acidoferrales bacterium]|nr:FecR family protein [Candidatus Acidoferrales bacterium]